MVRNCSDVLIPIQHFHLRDLCLEHRQRFTKHCSASRKVCWHPEGGLPDLHQPDAVRFPPETSRGGWEPCGGSLRCGHASGTKVRAQWAEGIRSEASLESRGCVCAEGGRGWQSCSDLIVIPETASRARSQPGVLG